MEFLNSSAKYPNNTAQLLNLTVKNRNMINIHGSMLGYQFSRRPQ